MEGKIVVKHGASGVAVFGLVTGVAALTGVVVYGVGRALRGRDYDGHGHGYGNGGHYDNDRRISHLEACEAASRVAINKNEELDRQRDHYEGVITKLEIKDANCYNIKGVPKLSRRQLCNDEYGDDERRGERGRRGDCYDRERFY